MAKTTKKDAQPEAKETKDVKSQVEEKATNKSSNAPSSKKTRTETDLLGSVEVPSNAYYGVHTLRAIENFQISYVTINTIPDFIRGMVQVKKATAMANRRLHVLPKKKAEAIIWACDQIQEEDRKSVV